MHIHFKIRTQRVEFTSQLYFPEDLNDEVSQLAPYSGNTTRRVRNNSDGIYSDGGRQLIPEITRDGSVYTAKFALGLRMA